MKRKSIEHDVHDFNQLSTTVPHQARRMHDIRTMSDGVIPNERKIVPDFTHSARKRR